MFLHSKVDFEFNNLFWTLDRSERAREERKREREKVRERGNEKGRQKIVPERKKGRERGRTLTRRSREEKQQKTGPKKNSASEIQPRVGAQVSGNFVSEFILTGRKVLTLSDLKKCELFYLFHGTFSLKHPSIKLVVSCHE